MNIVQIGLLGIVAVLMAIMLRQYRPEYSILVIVGTGCLIFYFGISQIGNVIELVLEYSDSIGSNQYMNILMKVIGITYICELCSGICKDAGYQSISAQVDIFGKLAILYAGTPIIVGLLELIKNI